MLRGLGLTHLNQKVYSTALMLDNTASRRYCSASYSDMTGRIARNMQNTPEDFTTQILVQIRDEMRSMRSSFEARFDTLQKRFERVEKGLDHVEVRLDSLDAKTGKRFNRLEQNFQSLTSDVKKFVSLVNDSVLHYANEMDRVRDRLDAVETKLTLPRLSD